MILGFLSQLTTLIIILSSIFILAIIVEYKYNLIANMKDYTNNILLGLNPFSKLQGFENPITDSVYEPSGIDDESRLSPGNAFSQSNEKLLSDYIPIQSNNEAENAWSRIPSQTCLKHDDGEKLKPLANYYQRTNNYKRTHPDDCSAPFHEMIGTFYKPTLGVGQTAPTGLPLPGSVVSCNGSKSEVVGNTSDFTNSVSD